MVAIQAAPEAFRQLQVRSRKGPCFCTIRKYPRTGAGPRSCRSGRFAGTEPFGQFVGAADELPVNEYLGHTVGTGGCTHRAHRD